jgi:AcrR family transcriptional regulator
MTRKSAVKEDLRVRRTRASLRAGLMELTVEKGFEAVTVKEICDRAMVNRTTFYRHFIDKYDLLEHYMEDLYKLLDEPPAASADRSQDAPPPGLIRMLEHLRDNADFYRVMLGPKGYPPFADKIRSYIERRIGRSGPPVESSPNPNRAPWGMMLRSASYAGLGAILWWLEESMPIGPLELATWAVSTTRAWLAFNSR